MRRWTLFLPLVIVLALAGLFLKGLSRTDNPKEVRSVLVGKAVPPFDLPALDGGRFQSGSLAPRRVAIVNFFASWCVPCRAEHAQLDRLARHYHIPVYGIAWKDSPANVTRYLKELGNPYTRVGIDQSGRTGIDWGVAGVPESYVITPHGKVGYRHWGDIRAEHVEQRLLPLIRDLEAQQ